MLRKLALQVLFRLGELSRDEGKDGSARRPPPLDTVEQPERADTLRNTPALCPEDVLRTAVLAPCSRSTLGAKEHAAISDSRRSRICSPCKYRRHCSDSQCCFIRLLYHFSKACLSN